MNLNDLVPYFELYKGLKENGKDTILNEELQKKEKEYAGKQITVTAVVSEINLPKNELISTYKPTEEEDSHLGARNLIGSHYFIFAAGENLARLIGEASLEKNDLVKLTGIITTLHRHSVLRMNLVSVSVLEKNHGITKTLEKKGCFIATAVYGGADTPEVQQFYRIRDHYLSQSVAGRFFIAFYYKVSPGMARWIQNKPILKQLTRTLVLDRILRRFN